jgi:hypothetical protein
MVARKGRRGLVKGGVGHDHKSRDEMLSDALRPQHQMDCRSRGWSARLEKTSPARRSASVLTLYPIAAWSISPRTLIVRATGELAFRIRSS